MRPGQLAALIRVRALIRRLLFELVQVTVVVVAEKSRMLPNALTTLSM